MVTKLIELVERETALLVNNQSLSFTSKWDFTENLGVA